MVRFENIDFLYGLFLLPLFVVVYFIFRSIRKRKLSALGDLNLLSILTPNVSDIKPLIKFAIMMIAMELLILGVANLQVGTKVEKATREGVDIMIALDVSKSMDADDIKPSRLERSKRAVSQLIDNLQNDRIGIIAFAGDAYLQLPLTTDFSAAKLFLSAINTGIVPKQGTAIGAAINLALESFANTKDELKKALIIITDGENHEDDAIGAAKNAYENGVIVHTIGMGTVEGGPIPVYNNGQRVDFLRDMEGSVVVTKLDAAMLGQIAGAANGTFVHASGIDPELTTVIEKIAGMEKKEFDSKLFSAYESRFQYFFGLAFLLLLVELLLSERKNKYISSLNLFGGKK
jgi:Ca-activated chloride channel family protein